MLLNISSDTIAAIATPIGQGGIGIIRISGEKAIRIAKTIFKKANTPDSVNSHATIAPTDSHRLIHGYIKDLETNRVLDEVLLTIMGKPHSYTAEDVVEIQSHSGFIVLNKILQTVIQNGARLAEPGEFTKRAFLNGRIDLSQAEAVAEIIGAKSEQALCMAADQLSGQLKNQVEQFIHFLTEQTAEIEACIEFPDDVDGQIDRLRIVDNLNRNIVEPIQSILQCYEDAKVYRDGIRLDIVGRPNVGKSSLLNRLIEKDKAIVTAIPGTTRDLVEEFLTIRGIPIHLTDTAGLHDSLDPVELLGIEKTRSNISKSDIVILVIDATEAFNAQDMSIYKSVKGKTKIIVINKVDLVPSRLSINIPHTIESENNICISAKTGEGIKELKDIIVRICLCGKMSTKESVIVPNLRQKNTLINALDSMKAAVEALAQNAYEELIICDLHDALNALKQITGEGVGRDIIDEIFSRFCIGK